MSHPHNDAPRRAAPRLSIRARTLALVGATLAALLLIIAFPVRAILLRSYADLEQREALQELGRATSALDEAVGDLDRTARDYASWDATYAYAESHDPAYVETNYPDETFATTGVNYVAVFDASGARLFERWVDVDDAEREPIPAGLSERIAAAGALLRHGGAESSRSGLLVLADHVLIVASRPILTSAYTGPVRGALVMAKELDDGWLDRQAAALRLAVQVHRVGEQLPAPLRDALEQLAAGGGPVALPRDGSTLVVSALLRDVDGSPALLLSIDMPRDIYAQGEASVWYVLGAVLVASVAVGAALALLIEWSVLARMTALARSVRVVGSRGDLGERVAVGGADELGEVAAAINGMLDSIERAQRERERAEVERGQLQEQLVRAREQFFQMTIHDLKTPISSLTGFLEMLQMTSLDPTQAKLATGVRRSAASLLQIVQDSLDAARLEEGRLALRREPADAAALLRAAAADARAWAAEEGKRVEVGEADSCELPLDRALMQRVLQNLVSNAIRHTPRGTAIRVGAACEPTSVRLWVWDGGPGIAPERQERIFERFGAPPAHAGGHRSSGLGLAFCRLAVEAHGGSIRVASAPGQGTTFTVQLPRHTVADGEPGRHIS